MPVAILGKIFRLQIDAADMPAQPSKCPAMSFRTTGATRNLVIAQPSWPTPVEAKCEASLKSTVRVKSANAAKVGLTSAPPRLPMKPGTGSASVAEHYPKEKHEDGNNHDRADDLA